jgi:arabinofuranosyltransferase
MNTHAETASRAPRRTFVLGLGAAAVLWGVSAACRAAWTCDDAYIVFRYARNLVNGVGLVFNAGERVEGFTNFFWVLWTAPAFALGIDPETWTNAWGVACFGATLALLAWDHARLRSCLPSPAWAAIPVAALAAAAHGDLVAFATSGLETSLFTFLLVSGYVLLVGPLPPSRALLAGAVFGLATLTRPDGALPAAIGGAFVLLRMRRVASAAAYTGGFLSLVLPLEAFRLAYYGSLVPNTYWAKSANVAWWDQGLRYLQLYGEKYGVLTFGPVLLLMAWLRWRTEGSPRRETLASAWLPRVLLALALASGYTLYVVRVGGDFMYARMLLPATPFYLILFELGWTALPSRTPAALALVVAALPVVVPPLVPRPVTGTRRESGVANEWEYYSLKRNAETDFRSEILRRFFDGLPVRVLVYGSEVRLAYRARIPTVVEAHGLTDPLIARQPIVQRGRPGHEKWPPPPYVVDVRKVHVAFQALGFETSRFPAYIPVVPIRFGLVGGFLLHWDPAMLDAWRRRGAVFEDFPSWLDGYLARMSSLSDERLRNDYEKFRHFYFQHVADPARERPFRARLGLP